MYGAMIGDIVGSKYEFNNIRTKDFPLFSRGCSFTDDTVMTAAVAKAILLSREAQYQNQNIRFSEILVRQMQEYGRRFPYPQGGYGGRFAQWLRSPDPKPYNSFGNGSAMRVSPCGIIAVELEEAQALARASAKVTHNHPEGIKGAEAVASAVFLAKRGKTQGEIREYITQHYYPLDETLDEIRSHYRFDESCQGTVPQAITAFLESDNFEDAIRNAISIGGDSDTVGAITGSIAWVYYTRKYRLGRPKPPLLLNFIKDAQQYIPEEFQQLDEALWNAALTRAGTYNRMGGCTPILSQAEWKEETQPARPAPVEAKDKLIYLKIRSGLIIKINKTRMTAHKLHPIQNQWYEAPEIFVDYEYGNLHGRPITVDDTYLTATGNWPAYHCPEPDRKKQAFCQKYLVLLELLYADKELRQWCREYSAYEKPAEHQGVYDIIYKRFAHEAYACDIVTPAYHDLIQKHQLTDIAAKPTISTVSVLTSEELLACIALQIRKDYGSNGYLIRTAIGEGYLLMLFREYCSR